MLGTIWQEPSYSVVKKNPFAAFIFINHNGRGWQEKYWLPGDSDRDAYLLTQKLAKYRSWLLCDGAVMEWVCLRQNGPPWWEWPAIGPAILPTGRWGTCRSITDSMLVNYRTTLGKYGSKFMKAIPRTIYADARANPTKYWIPGVALPEPDPVTDTWLTIWKFFHAFCRDRTCHAWEQIAPWPAKPHPWKLTNWDQANYRKTRNHQVGEAVRRASWESLVYAENPGFTPCGEAVTVLRACYPSSVRWGVDWPLSKILFYWSKPGAAVFPLKHIFWGWRRDNDTINTGNPGEVVAHRTYAFSLGYSFGDAPGDHYCGTQKDYLGQRVWPADAPLPPELVCVAGCDAVVPTPIIVDDLPGAFVENFTVHFTFPTAYYTLTHVAAGWVKVTPKVVPDLPGFGHRDINSWKASGPAPFDRAYIAGLNTDTRRLDFTPFDDTLYALPIFYAPGGYVDKLLIHVKLPAAPTATARLGIYEAISDTNIYPGDLVYDSGDLPIDVGGIVSVACDLFLHPQRLYWMTLITTSPASAPDLAGQDGIDFFPVWGLDSTDLDQFTAHGHYVAYPYGALPDPFPNSTGATFMYGGFGPTPKLGLHYEGADIVIGGGSP